MKIIPTEIPEVKLITPDIHADQRGFFFESYHQKKYLQNNISDIFIQDNISKSQQGTLRGLHYQSPPFAQAKLVQVILGCIIDVAVDIRKGSPTFGHYVKAELSDQNHHLLYIPEGFAHGFFVTSKIAIIHYKCNQLYHPESEKSLRYNDPQININWKLNTAPILSEKDKKAPFLKEIN